MGSTIPTELIVTNERPDVLIVDKTPKTHVNELTVPFEISIEKDININKQNTNKSCKISKMVL